MLFEPLVAASLQLANRAVMAPMTRSRAVDANTPNALMAELKSRLRAAFQGLFILAGGFDRASAGRALEAGQADLIAFARPFLANPDLVERMRCDAALSAVDMATFYTPGPKGYTDYPVLAT